MNKEKVANLMSATLVQSIIENERAKNRLFLLRLMGALLVLQLPAGAGDIGAARRAKRCLDVMFLERIEPVFDRLLGCCREIAALDIVHRKEIHVAKQASAIFDEGVEIFLSVVDILDEKIFEGHATIRFLNVALESRAQAFQGLTCNMRHDLVANRLNRRMKRNSQCELL